jgi:uncharacterized protein YhaN
VRISRFHVDGFGGLADFGVDDLSPGLVIVSGPNEAGKSTMLDFFTTMLFGFPTRRDNPRFRAPVRGGRHGGRLTLASEGRQGSPQREWQIERYSSPKRELAVRLSDHGPMAEDDLRRALGGADEALFRAVFAVDLSDLGNADALGRDDVRELLFSASIVGQRRSAARAMANLQKQRLELARMRQGDARANRLMADLDTVRRSLDEAGREAAGFPAQHAELVRLEREVADARSDSQHGERRTRELDLLVRLWDVLERKREVDKRLGASGEPAPFCDWLEANGPELQALRAACSGHLERAAQLSDLRNQRGGIELSVQAALGSLGPGWDRGRIRSSEGWIGLVDEARRYRDLLADRQAKERTARVLAEESDAAAELVNLVKPSPAVARPGDASLCSDLDPDEQARRVSELRRNLAEQRRLGAEIQLGGRRRLGASVAPDKRWITSTAVVAVLMLGLALAAALEPGRLVVLVVCGVLAVLGASLLTFTLATRRGLAAEDGDLTSAMAAHHRVAARVAELAASLGLGPRPSDSDVETVAERVEAARTAERSRDEERRHAAAAAGRSNAARDCLRAASDDLDEASTSFSAWKLSHRLGESLSPDGVLESLSVLQGAWKDLAALERVDARIEQRQAEIIGFEVRLAHLAAGLGRVGGPAEALGADPAGTLNDLCSSLEEVLELRATKASLARASEECEAELERSLGLGPEAGRLRAELEGGDVLAWDQERAAVARARSEALQGLEKLLRAHQDASNQLRGLAGSARIAELEQQRLALEQELGDVLRSWAVLGCARLLLERTLRRHEQERQPAVLARAGERFAKVTEGRYTCLLPSVNDEGGRDSLRVVSSSGAEMDAAGLSRGTIEQLYLCLRLGLAETFAERAEPLPMILDDVLVNFDPARAASMAEALADTAERHQVLFLTCHPHLVELVRRVAPQAQVVHLDRI